MAQQEQARVKREVFEPQRPLPLNPLRLPQTASSARSWPCGPAQRGHSVRMSHLHGPKARDARLAAGLFVTSV
ncbi:hypothetical protein CesoFtcFv8_021475 [Champsocephalus esox]|uniref:Uncharacterized protein n=1 Tax=Champsocephalus esox TaxID=159716 RepID=A0AAN8GL23_9TELE|nr:hypothetical protein CesoFtcFv8_021475 [Champsocephalus esox]